MKYTLLLLLTAITITASAQDKISVHYNRLNELKGTAYVVATVETFDKMFGRSSSDLMFINTQTGETKNIDFSEDAYIEKVEQIRIDSLGINRVVVSANTVNLNNIKASTGEIPRRLSCFQQMGKKKFS